MSFNYNNSITTNSNSFLFQKKDKFRKQIRTSSIHSYMKQVRQEMKESQIYQKMIKLIEQTSTMGTMQQTVISKQQFLQLIKMANLNEVGIIVHLADLFMKGKVTISMLEQCQAEQRNNNKLLLQYQVIKSQGWTILMKVLVGLKYCDKKILSECRKCIISYNKLRISRTSLQFALETVVDLLKHGRDTQQQNIAIEYFLKEEQFVLSVVNLAKGSYGLQQQSNKSAVKYIKSACLKIISFCLQRQKQAQFLLEALDKLSRLPMKTTALLQQILIKNYVFDNQLGNCQKQLIISITNNLIMSKRLSYPLIKHCAKIAVVDAIDSLQLQNQRFMAKQSYQLQGIKSKLKIIQEFLFLVQTILQELQCKQMLQLLIELDSEANIRLDQILIKISSLNSIGIDDDNDLFQTSTNQLQIEAVKIIMINQEIQCKNREMLKVLFDKLKLSQTTQSTAFSEFNMLICSRLLRQLDCMGENNHCEKENKENYGNKMIQQNNKQNKTNNVKEEIEI